MEILNVANTHVKEILVQMINKAIDENQLSSKEAAHILQTSTTYVYKIKMLRTANFSWGRLLVFLVRLDYKVTITINIQEVIKQIEYFGPTATSALI